MSASAANRRRNSLPAGLLVGLLLIALSAAGPATAGTVRATSGSLTMTSETGDYIGAGQDWAYDAQIDTVSFGSERWGAVRAFVTAANGDFWLLQLAAPAARPLSTGVYGNAQRFADDIHPGLDVEGMGRGCNDTNGSFTILDVSYGPYGYLNSLHATFEQRCGAATATLRGELNLTAPPAPAPLGVTVTVDTNATVDRSDGKVRLRGTISCSTTVPVATVAGDLTQQQKKDTAYGYFNQVFVTDCDTTPQTWTATVAPTSVARFAAGDTAAAIRGIAVDDFYTNYLGTVIAAQTAIEQTVTLRNG
jgi:hypothetical protein